MSRTPRNLRAHELIGLECEVVECRDPTLRSLKGRVVDESKNIISVQCSNKLIRIPKDIATFNFMLPSGATAIIPGRSLAFRPEDRVNKVKA
jgi:ribonuclease P protein subunit POP4